MRGNLIVYFSIMVIAGSIPACAGEPWIVVRSAAAARVYPRVCGGTEKVVTIRVRYLGLSPRVRGNPYHHPLPVRD